VKRESTANFPTTPVPAQSDPSTPAVNSREWREGYFQKSREANSDRQQTRHFMERLVANLPEPELRFLRSGPLTILDWGCAFGDGVDVLAASFPESEVTGLDFARTAVDEATRAYPQRRFIHAAEGVIPDWYDVITNSNCLEHFEFPISVLQSQLLACRSVFVALVPYNEWPLSDYHRAQFREESFPEQLAGFVRLHCGLAGVDERFRPGGQLLVVYGSEAYAHRRTASVSAGGRAEDRQEAEFAEKEKWDKYYAELPDVGEDPETHRFNLEFVQAVSDVLPGGGRTLEAGCGAGWQSVALARSGRFQTSLLDFSLKALSYAARLFEREGLQTQLMEADVLQPGPAEFDLVFSAGVLEHYSSDEQIALLRGMKSRTRQYVLVLVPNRRCYWYWLWRFHRSVRGGWKWGKEVPAGSLAQVFEAAGLRFLGQRYFGAAWSESFISEFFPAGALREEILTIHRSEVIPQDQKAYLVGALGTVDQDRELAPGWTVPAPAATESTAVLAAALADALAIRNEAISPALLRAAPEAGSSLAGSLSRLTASNADLIKLHREAVETGLAEVAKRDETIAHYQRLEAELFKAAASDFPARILAAGRRWFRAGSGRSQ
jgi:2-polyprenyl-3-methyl-5-hydroxy-6-metoxy-1,4-benzoquinol methylase